MSNRRSRRRAARGGGDEIGRLQEQAQWSSFTTQRYRRFYRPTRATAQGMRDGLAAALFLFGIMSAAIVAITLVVFAILALVHLLTA
jgi:hypothetical protein